jgi:hypothetical protein
MKIFLITFLFLITSIHSIQASPLNRIIDDFKYAISDTSSGTSEAQSFPFGEVRLLSCASGIRDTNTLIAGLQFSLKEGWKLRHPSIQAFAGNADTTLLTPLKQTHNDIWTDNYSGTVFFPIVLSFPNPPHDSTNLSVIATALACSEIGLCRRETIVQSLPLPIEHNHTTAYCSYIQNNLHSTAIPTNIKGITGTATRLSDTEWHATISFPKAPKNILVQTIKGTSEISSTLLGREARFIFPIEEDFPKLGDTITLFLKTPAYFYRLDLPVSDAPVTQPQKTFPWFSALLGGFLLFLLSPLWPLWLTNTSKTVAQSRQKTWEQIMKLTPAIIVTIITTTTGLLDFCQSFQIFNILTLIGLFFFLIRPTPSFALAVMGLILLPKPFWQDAVFYNTPAVAFVWILGTIGALLPFWFKARSGFKMLTFFHIVTTSTALVYAVLKRLPFIILGLYLSLILFLNIQNQPPLFTQDAPTTQPTLVSITKPICWSCAWDRNIILKTGTIQGILSNNNIRLTSLPYDSPIVVQIAPDLPQRTAPAYVLLLPNGRRFVLPESLTIHKLYRFLESSLK